MNTRYSSPRTAISTAEREERGGDRQGGIKLVFRSVDHSLLNPCPALSLISSLSEVLTYLCAPHSDLAVRVPLLCLQELLQRHWAGPYGLVLLLLVPVVPGAEGASDKDGVGW